MVAADVGGERKRRSARIGRGERARPATRWGKMCGEASWGRRQRKPRTDAADGGGEATARDRATDRSVGPAAGKSSAARGNSSSDEEDERQPRAAEAPREGKQVRRRRERGRRVAGWGIGGGEAWRWGGRRRCSGGGGPVLQHFCCGRGVAGWTILAKSRSRVYALIK